MKRFLCLFLAALLLAGTAHAWQCPACSSDSSGNFCSNCGAKKPDDNAPWTCPACSAQATSNFCSNCGAQKPASATVTPAPRGEEYVLFTYNGVSYDCSSSMYLNGREVLYNAYEIWLTPIRCKLTSINFTIPQYAKAGDSFVVWKGQMIKGLDFYVAEDNGPGQYYVAGFSEFSNFGFAASTDYYVMNIIDVSYQGGATVIEGTIRARFLYDTISYEIDFKVKVP